MGTIGSVALVLFVGGFLIAIIIAAAGMEPKQKQIDEEKSKAVNNMSNNLPGGKK